MSGSPPPSSSQLPRSPQGCYSRPRRSRNPPDWFGDSVRREVSELPDLVLSENEGESDDEDSDQTIFTPISSRGPPPSRVTGPAFSPIPFNLSLSLSPGPAFPASPSLQHGDTEEAAPVQQGGADLVQQSAPVLQGGAGHQQRSYEHVPEDLTVAGGVSQAPRATPLPQEGVSLPVQATPGRREQLQLAGHQAAHLVGRVAEWERQQQSPAVGQPATPANIREVREVAGIGAEQVLLEDLIDPHVPGPHPGPVVEDSDGWNCIDQWDTWACALCEFPTLLDIPRCYREVWARAMDRILTEIQEAEDGIQLERGLKWLLILPKALFRQGRRGGKAGKGLISQRINSLIRGDWGSLLTMLKKDRLLVD